jgi:hypothetical protein
MEDGSVETGMNLERVSTERAMSLWLIDEHEKRGVWKPSLTRQSYLIDY